MSTHNTMSYVYMSKEYNVLFFFVLDFTINKNVFLINNIACERACQNNKYQHLIGSDKQEVEQWFLNEIQINACLNKEIFKNFQKFSKKGNKK